MIAIDFGTAGKWIASSLKMIFLRSTSMPGTLRGVDPVAVMCGGEQGLLPAIYFVFSRAGCDRSVEWLMASGIRLNEREEAERANDRLTDRRNDEIAISEI